MVKKNQTKNNKGRVAVIGLGYVGLPLALLADKKGYTVTGIDIDKEKVALINKKTVPFVDKTAAKALKHSKLKAYENFGSLANADIIVICVPTPVHKDHTPNLTPVIESCKQIANHLIKGQLVILESTVNPGVCDEVVIPLLEEKTGMKEGKDFYVAHCPERINPGDKNYDVSNIARVVGSNSKRGLQKALEFYSSIIDAPIKPMKNLKEAEAVKIVENCFRDVNIAFVNELAMSFARLGIDIKNVIEGASTKPYSFMAHYPGCGVGGHCIAVDPYYLIEYANSHTGFNHKFLSLAREINNGMPKFTVDTLVKALKDGKYTVKETKVAVLGLAYKANIGDCRESPAYKVIEELRKLGINPKVFDPYVKEESTVASIGEALLDVKAVIITTAHKEFVKLTPGYFKDRGVKVIVDGRNCLDKAKFIKAGIAYYGIGR